LSSNGPEQRNHWQIDSEQVFVIGGANIDTTGVARSRIIAGESSPGTILKTYGGVARNIAETLSRLDVPTSFAGVFGDDRNGENMLEHLLGAGVNTHRLTPANYSSGHSRSTPEFVSIVTSTGESVAQVADMSLLDESCEEMIAHLAPLIEKARMVVIDANLAEPVLAAIFDMNITAPIFADAVSPAKCRRLSPWLRSVYLLKANEAEAAALTGMPRNTRAYSDQLLKKLVRLGPKRVLLSKGANGAQLWDGEQRFDAPSPETRPLNLNGCGDSLLAGVIAASLRNYPAAVQLSWGQQLAARASEVHGTVNPAININELEALVRG